MLKLFLDHNFDHRILRGLLRRIPLLDFTSTQMINRPKELDPRIITRAVTESRVILTRDQKTFPKHAYAAIEAGEEMNGVIVVPASLAIGKAVDELELIVICSDEFEYKNRVEYLPFFR